MPKQVNKLLVEKQLAMAQRLGSASCSVCLVAQFPHDIPGLAHIMSRGPCCVSPRKWVMREEARVICSSWRSSSHVHTFRDSHMAVRPGGAGWRPSDSNTPAKEAEMQSQEAFLLVTSELVHGRRMGTLDAFCRLPLFLTLHRVPYL